MGLIKPKKLKPGDTIGIIAPSGWVQPDHLSDAAAHLRSFGYNVVVHPQCHERTGVSAGSIEQRVTALHEIFVDPKIDAVFSATGGQRAMQLLDKIDYDVIRNNPKIFIGYSDTTSLLSAFNRCADLVTIHGLSLMGFRPERDRADQEKTLKFLSGDTDGNLFKNLETLSLGEAEGILWGGNLRLINGIEALGDRFMPSMDGAILMIEDIGEELRLIDRMFTNFRLSGLFDRIGGIVIGHITDIGDNGTTYKFNCTLYDLLAEYTAHRNIPIVRHASFGHEVPNMPFPLGIKAKLTAASNGIPQLQLLESPFTDA